MHRLGHSLVLPEVHLDLLPNAPFPNVADLRRLDRSRLQMSFKMHTAEGMITILKLHPYPVTFVLFLLFFLIDDHLHSAILCSLEQTHCTRMWCYMSD